ncbi:MAG: restriction endonuclease, partial [Chloroflexota bacterium]|nr:restriction endonuclease [Chloroflexota bacterium]
MASVIDAKVNVPAYHKMLWPTLQALKQMGGSGSVQEIMDRVIEIEGYTETQQSRLHGKGPGT